MTDYPTLKASLYQKNIAILGPSESWSPTLKTVIDSVFLQTVPMVALIGPELIQIYNDPFARLLPDANSLGEPTTLEAIGLTTKQYQQLYNGTVLQLEIPVLSKSSTAAACLSLIQDGVTPLGILVTVLPTSSSKQLEKQDLFEAANLGWWQLDIRKGELFLDERVQEMFGFTSSCVPYDPSLTIIHPDDRVRVAQEIKAALDPTQNHRYTVEYRILKPEGVRWIRSRGFTHFEEEGKSRCAILLFGISDDITVSKQIEAECRQNEERLRLALEAADLGTWEWNPITDLVTFSPRAAEIFGIDPFAEYSRAKLREFIREDFYEAAVETAQRAVLKCVDYDIEYIITQPTGNERWVAATGRGIYDGDKKLLRTLGVIQDITLRKNVEAEREQLLESERAARSESERTSRMKDEFLAILSHELRTPLNAILGWAQLLKRGTKTEKDLTQGLTTIERNARIQTQLIADLLDMSRIISGKLRLELQPVLPSSIIESAIHTVLPSATQKQIRIQQIIDPYSRAVSGDPARLQQVIWNLLSNAIKFTPPGGNITVSLEQMDSYLEITVADTGQGIKPDFLPYVFERFRQADGSITRTHGGLGLGLSIVKHLTELHGGTLQVQSAGEHLGTTFTLSLPLQHVHLQQIPQSVPKIQPSTNLCNVTALVVDDEQDSRELVKRVLEDFGVTVITASSAVEGLVIIEEKRPTIVLSDIGMPGMDGYQFLSKVRDLGDERGGLLPAIALTAFARTVDRELALQAGFAVHLTKPIEPAKLIETVSRLLDGC